MSPTCGEGINTLEGPDGASERSSAPPASISGRGESLSSARLPRASYHQMVTQPLRIWQTQLWGINTTLNLSLSEDPVNSDRSCNACQISDWRSVLEQACNFKVKG
jgi:hypothetical protein